MEMQIGAAWLELPWPKVTVERPIIDDCRGGNQAHASAPSSTMAEMYKERVHRVQEYIHVALLTIIKMCMPNFVFGM